MPKKYVRKGDKKPRVPNVPPGKNKEDGLPPGQNVGAHMPPGAYRSNAQGLARGHGGTPVALGRGKPKKEKPTRPGGGTRPPVTREKPPATTTRPGVIGKAKTYKPTKHTPRKQTARTRRTYRKSQPKRAVTGYSRSATAKTKKIRG